MIGSNSHAQSPDPDRGLPAEQGKGGQLDLQTALKRVLSTARVAGALWRPRFVSCRPPSLSKSDMETMSRHDRLSPAHDIYGVGLLQSSIFVELGLPL